MIFWVYVGKAATVVGYAVFFVWMTRNAIRREIEREAEAEADDLFV